LDGLAGQVGMNEKVFRAGRQGESVLTQAELTVASFFVPFAGEAGAGAKAVRLAEAGTGSLAEVGADARIFWGLARCENGALTLDRAAIEAFQPTTIAGSLVNAEGGRVLLIAPSFEPPLIGLSGAPLIEVTPESAMVRSNAQLVQDVCTRADTWARREGLTGTAQQLGTWKHGYADRLLTRYQEMFGDGGLTTEVRYINGAPWQRGIDPLTGSIRLDVVEGPLNNPTWVWEYKFGNAGLTAGRITEIRTGAGLGPKVPVQEVRP
jgi:hypothetical protein